MIPTATSTEGPVPRDHGGARLDEDAIRPLDTRERRRRAMLADLARLLAGRNRFTAADCPACGRAPGADERGMAFARDGLSWTRCRACRTCFTDPRPDAAALAAYYEGSELYRIWAEEVFPRTDAVRRERIHGPRLERLLEACARYGAGREVLVEVGAGYGTFASMAAERGAFAGVWAVEPTVPPSAAAIHPGVRWVPRRIEALGPEDLPAADVIASFETIEHLLEPRAFVRDCATRLRPGGLLLLTCPNVDGFDVIELGSRASAIQPEHVTLFTPGSMRSMLAACGLEPLEVTTPGRLDAGLVRDAVLEGRHELHDPWLRRVLLEAWDELGAGFQAHLAASGQSSHLQAVARRPA